MKTLIIVSSKSWHKKNFDSLVKNSRHDWYYVSTREELNFLLKKNKSPRYLFFLHWNWKVPAKIYKKYECICFHMTDLPYGRGGSPLQNLILDGKKKTMVSAFRMLEGMDEGPVYKKKLISLSGRAIDIYKRAGKISYEIINWIVKKEPIPNPQLDKATYFVRRKPEQSLLPKNTNLSNIHDFIRMLDAPTYPYAFIKYGNFRLEFNKSRLNDKIIEANVKIKKYK